MSASRKRTTHTTKPSSSSSSSSSAKALTPAQSKKAEQFIAVAACSSAQAARLLAHAGWNLEQAIEEFFANPPAHIEPPDHQPQPPEALLDALFDDPRFEKAPAKPGLPEQVLSQAGLLALLQAAGIPEDDEHSEHLFAWRCGAKRMGALSRDELKRGMRALGAERLEALPPLLARAREGLRDGPSFSTFYQFLYDFVKGPERRTLDVDEALALWRMWIVDNGADHAHRPMTLLREFLDWLENVNKEPVTRDLWHQLLIFVCSIDEALEAYDPNDAWPVRIDEFIDWYKKEKMKK